jgi:hypothetical protein
LAEDCSRSHWYKRRARNASEYGAKPRSREPNDRTTFAVTSVNPSTGGVYDNVVGDNVADGNGTDKAPTQFGGGGRGSGIRLFASGPGSAVYDNVVIDNEVSGDGLAGIAMHAQLPGGEDIDGNCSGTTTLGPTTSAATRSTARPDRGTSR